MKFPVKDFYLLRKRNKIWLSLLLSTVVITAFLFFLDEGNYDFAWLASPGHLIVFTIYCLVILFFQSVFYAALRFISAQELRVRISILTGTPLALFVLMKLIF